MIPVIERLTVEKDGTVKVPARLLGEKGFDPGTEVVAESAGGGLVLLHRPDPYEIEIYTDERLAEFEEENRMSKEEEARVAAALARLRR